jgi:Lhr-like helicase
MFFFRWRVRQYHWWQTRTFHHLPCRVRPALFLIVAVESHTRAPSAAFDAITNRENVVVATPTASGKSYVFYLPILQAILSATGKLRPCALFLFPTKVRAVPTPGCGAAHPVAEGDTSRGCGSQALANDQMRQLRKLVGALPREAAGTLIDELYLYNGDTTPAEKALIPGKGRIIFTTPDSVRAPNEGVCNARYRIRQRPH